MKEGGIIGVIFLRIYSIMRCSIMAYFPPTLIGTMG